MWYDDPSTDAPYLSALNINKNSIKIFVKGERIGGTAKVIPRPQTDYVNVVNKCIVIPSYERDSLSINRDWIGRKNTFSIEGTVNKTLYPDTVSAEADFNIFGPEKYFLTLFREALERKKITGKKDIALGEKPEYAVPLFTLERGLDSVLINMNKMSDNLSAEMLLYSLAAEDSGKPASAEAGLKWIDSLVSFIGFNSGNYKFADGSGVSRYNLVSAELLLSVLKFIYSRPDFFNLLYESFPVAGIDGTLKTRMIGTSAENNVHAKTGGLMGVNSLSGYLHSAGGDLIAFSILIQNYTGGSAEAQFFIDEICRILNE
jgi:D-alanyl-D-alanine carboxypeptidase/D-alanyl-D-alanine-endopeptidase (penicillin-binding protein 4)